VKKPELKKRGRWPDTPPVFNSPMAMAAAEGGGLLLEFRMPPIPEGRNGGCGSPTHVEGTNGGLMACGDVLSYFGRVGPYYCGTCAEARKAAGLDTGL
jgi:hypothetical protein